MELLILLSLLLTPPYAPDGGMTPGTYCTPNSVDFHEYRYQERIPYCRRNVSSATKQRVYDAYGIPSRSRGSAGGYTIDHLIPLSIGGDNSEDNLWPEHESVKATRQNLELDLYNKLKAGEITQDEAVNQVLEAKRNCCFMRD
jgi:hypothetical protein